MSLSVGQLELLILIASLVGIAYAGLQTMLVLREDEGTERMREISAAIREGALAFLGLSINLPTASLGNIINEGVQNNNLQANPSGPRRAKRKRPVRGADRPFVSLRSGGYYWTLN